MILFFTKFIVRYVDMFNYIKGKLQSWRNKKPAEVTKEVKEEVKKTTKYLHLQFLKSKNLLIPVGIIVVFHTWLHLSNPYAAVNFVQQPFTTDVGRNGEITYTQHFTPYVLSDPISDFIGYYRQGFLIVQNTFFGGDELEHTTSEDIIGEIHDIRFDPDKPYLISGDQFSVLYTRNLGVFYNQLLDPNTAQSEEDWHNRQRIYLQSVLYATEGLSVGDTPKTTLVPIGPRAVTHTSVHPGDYGSDTVYGLLYAIDKMNSENTSVDGKYKIQTKNSINRLLSEKHDKLEKIVNVYLDHVQDPNTKLVKTDIKLAAARDGVTRSGSMYDNMVLWKTLELANKLGIKEMQQTELDTIKAKIKDQYWNEKNGYYANDTKDDSFSSDWLIGFPIGFFDLADKIDLERTQKTVTFIENNGLSHPLPIKYQLGNPDEAPFIIRHFVPDYGGEIIWSYWGAQYITLLNDLYEVTHNKQYHELAGADINAYNLAIVRDGGFAETFNKDGKFMRVGLYKSIRVTGWVVQFEHAIYEYNNPELQEK